MHQSRVSRIIQVRTVTQQNVARDAQRIWRPWKRTSRRAARTPSTFAVPETGRPVIVPGAGEKREVLVMVNATKGSSEFS